MTVFPTSVLAPKMKCVWELEESRRMREDKNENRLVVPSRVIEVAIFMMDFYSLL
jgi:hypothetical protein